MKHKRDQFVQYLTAQGFQATGHRIVNQLARYDQETGTSIVIWIDPEGRWKLYDEFGIEFAFGNSLWELEAQL